MSWKDKIYFFLAGQPSTTSFAILVWWHSKGHLGYCSSLYDSPFLLWSGLYPWMYTSTRKMDVSSSSTNLGNIPKSYSAPPQVTSEKRANQRSWWYGTKSVWDAIRSSPGASPPESVVEPGGMSKAPVSVRDRLSPTREGKLQCKVCLHVHLEQGRMLPLETSQGCGCRFFLSYRWELIVPEPLP